MLLDEDLEVCSGARKGSGCGLLEYDVAIRTSWTAWYCERFWCSPEIQRTGLACHGNDFAGWQRPGRVVLPDGGQEVCTGAREGSGFADAISWGAAACWSCCCDLDLMDSMVL